MYPVITCTVPEKDSRVSLELCVSPLEMCSCGHAKVISIPLRYNCAQAGLFVPACVGLREQMGGSIHQGDGGVLLPFPARRSQPH